MDIGGIDLVVKTGMSPETQKRFFLSYLQHMWPDGVIEHVDDSEFFYYKNSNVKHSWDDQGRTDWNADKMVHVMPGLGEINIVHEGLDEEEIRNNFAANREFA